MNGRKLLLYALVAALVIKLLALAFLPETELVDTMFHLHQARLIQATQGMDAKLLDTALPLYYLVVNALLSFLPIALPFTKLVPFALTLAFVGLAYLFYRRAFGSGYLLPLVFLLSLPALTLFGSVNYTNAFAALVVLAAAHFLAPPRKAPTRTHFLLAGFFVSLIPFTHVTATLAFPAFFLGWAWLAHKRFSRRTFCALAAFFLLLAGAWYGARILSEHCLATGLFGCGGIPNPLPGLQGYTAINGFGQGPEGVKLEKVARLPLFDTAFRASLDLWGFPPYGTLEGVLGPTSTFLAGALFSLLTLALTLLLLRGLFSFWRTNKTHVLAFLSNHYATFHGIVFFGGLSDYARYALPTEFVASAAIFAGLRSPWPPLARKLFKACLAVFLVYSLVYSLAFVYYFHGVYEKHAGLYAFADTLPKQSNVFSSTRHQQIEFLTGLRSSGKEELFGQPMSYALVDGVLKAGGFTHLAWTCYKDLVPRPLVDQLEANGRLKPIYSDSCTQVYTLNPP